MLCPEKELPTIQTSVRNNPSVEPMELTVLEGLVIAAPANASLFINLL